MMNINYLTPVELHTLAAMHSGYAWDEDAAHTRHENV